MTKHSSNASAALSVDTTQTLRPLRMQELQAPQPRWFAIQLVVSERPVNLETMPRLDVFAGRRLYAVVDRRGDTTQYSLRLGFFEDAASADLICGYVTTFFASPRVLQVSAAEQARFAETSAAPKIDTHQSNGLRDDAARRTERPQPPAVNSAAAPSAIRNEPAIGSASRSHKNTRSTGISPRKTKSLGEQLLEEAREVRRSRIGRPSAPKEQRSWLSRLFGKPAATAKPRGRSAAV